MRDAGQHEPLEIVENRIEVLRYLRRVRRQCMREVTRAVARKDGIRARIGIVAVDPTCGASERF